MLHISYAICLTFKARFDKKQCLTLLWSCEQIQIGVLLTGLQLSLTLVSN